MALSGGVTRGRLLTVGGWICSIAIRGVSLSVALSIGVRHLLGVGEFVGVIGVVGFVLGCSAIRSW